MSLDCSPIFSGCGPPVGVYIVSGCGPPVGAHAGCVVLYLLQVSAVAAALSAAALDISLSPTTPPLQYLALTVLLILSTTSAPLALCYSV